LVGVSDYKSEKIGIKINQKKFRLTMQTSIETKDEQRFDQTKVIRPETFDHQRLHLFDKNSNQSIP
jgi:hypothetical protein